MKKINTLYWIFTALLATLMLISGIPDIIMIPEAVKIFQSIGFPLYIGPFLGVAKVLGAIAIIFPGFPRLKEWAYAGFTFDLAGAMYSHIRSGSPMSEWAPIFIGFALIAASYILFHKRQEMETAHS